MEYVVFILREWASQMALKNTYGNLLVDKR